MLRSLCLTAMLALPSVAFGQASTTVLWYHGNGGTTNNSNEFASHISGVLLGSVDFQTNWAALDLDTYRYVILARPTQAFDAGQISTLSAFLDGGGFVVVIGDSLAAGQPQIDTINALMTGLGRTAQLESEQFTNPLDDMTNLPTCSLGEVINGGSILDAASPLSLESCGDIEPGLATIIEGYSITIESTPFNFDLLVEEDGVLLTADYDFFSGDDCGIIAKRSFWNNLWARVCDRDEDGATSVECGGFDCDDSDPQAGADIAYLDLDGDGFGDDGSPAPCVLGAVEQGGDCDDDDPDINPGVAEVCDGVDNDCMGGIDDDVAEGPEWYADFDGDGYGRDDDEPVIACDPPPNHVDQQGDCLDTNANAHIDATEICNNGVDENCNGTADEGCGGNTNPPPPPGSGGGGCGCSAGVGAPALGFGLLTLAGLFARRRRLVTE
ncbi:MAG: putative metal-binding motif-containing protein [Alphaproteobacteria bacterium]|nr:putative metal-binding motif-containing protein [Alphaproteobacteria bacterium]